MNTFIHRHLDPVDRLGETLLGLIMAMGFTGAVRLGLERADNRALLTSVFGCNVAWAIVDGVMYVLTRLFERGRRIRMLHAVRNAGTEEESMQRIDRELGNRLEPLTTENERRQIYHWAMEWIRHRSHDRARVHWEDVLGGAAVALVIVIATVPVVVPFIVFQSPNTAVHASNLVAMAMLFWLGCWWGREVGASPVRVGVGLMLTGVALVSILIALAR
jgi:hypothetical protein